MYWADPQATPDTSCAPSLPEDLHIHLQSPLKRRISSHPISPLRRIANPTAAALRDTTTMKQRRRFLMNRIKTYWSCTKFVPDERSYGTSLESEEEKLFADFLSVPHICTTFVKKLTFFNEKTTHAKCILSFVHKSGGVISSTQFTNFPVKAST